MSEVFPYDHLPAYQFWHQDVPDSRHNPHGTAHFQFDRSTKIASAGSCFARHIAENLQAYGFHYCVTEPGPSWLSVEQRQRYHYGPYSARYGNIYTSLQLLQLLKRALGLFQPQEDHWQGPNGWYDPFRPRIQPDGFSSVAELQDDRQTHLKAVNRMFHEVEVFIFTLGLTEVWGSRFDQAVFPMCPGRGYGVFDPQRYVWRNLSVTENIAYLQEFVALLQQINPHARILFSVSPVPLAATLESRHVVQATCYTKSVLRVAVEEIRRQYTHVDYFAAYELVMNPAHRESFFHPGDRHLSQAGLQAVMDTLFAHFTAEDPQHLEKCIQSPLSVPWCIEDDKYCEEEEILKKLASPPHG